MLAYYRSLDLARQKETAKLCVDTSMAGIAGTVAFMEEAKTAGLNEATVSKMVDQDIDSLSVVGLLREANISALSLSIGQRLLLSSWVSGLRDIESRDSSRSEPAFDEATL